VHAGRNLQLHSIDLMATHQTDPQEQPSDSYRQVALHAHLQPVHHGSSQPTLYLQLVVQQTHDTCTWLNCIGVVLNSVGTRAWVSVTACVLTLMLTNIMPRVYGQRCYPASSASCGCR
jgi:hypothetical protein